MKHKQLIIAILSIISLGYILALNGQKIEIQMQPAGQQPAKLKNPKEDVILTLTRAHIPAFSYDSLIATGGGSAQDMATWNRAIAYAHTYLGTTFTKHQTTATYVNNALQANLKDLHTHYGDWYSKGQPYLITVPSSAKPADEVYLTDKLTVLLDLIITIGTIIDDVQGSFLTSIINRDKASVLLAEAGFIQATLQKLYNETKRLLNAYTEKQMTKLMLATLDSITQVQQEFKTTDVAKIARQRNKLDAAQANINLFLKEYPLNAQYTKKLAATDPNTILKNYEKELARVLVDLEKPQAQRTVITNATAAYTYVDAFQKIVVTLEEQRAKESSGKKIAALTATINSLQKAIDAIKAAYPTLRLTDIEQAKLQDFAQKTGREDVFGLINVIAPLQKEILKKLS